MTPRHASTKKSERKIIKNIFLETHKKYLEIHKKLEQGYGRFEITTEPGEAKKLENEINNIGKTKSSFSFCRIAWPSVIIKERKIQLRIMVQNGGP